MRSFVIALLTVTAATPQAEPGVRDFVQRWETASRSIRATAANEQRIAACRELMDSAFDFDAMAEASLAKHWRAMSAAQRRSLSAALAKRAAGDCSDRIEGYDGGAFTLLGVRNADDGTRLATAEVRLASRTIRVMWSLKQKGAGTWKAADMAVDGHSLSAGYRTEFLRLLDLKGHRLDAAIRALAR